MNAADTIMVNATDQFGNTATTVDIAVTVNGLPVISVPGPVTVGVGKALAITGVSLTETGATSGEKFTVTLADTNGLLSVERQQPVPRSAGEGTATLTVSGDAVAGAPTRWRRSATPTTSSRPTRSP